MKVGGEATRRGGGKFGEKEKQSGGGVSYLGALSRREQRQVRSVAHILEESHISQYTTHRTLTAVPEPL